KLIAVNAATTAVILAYGFQFWDYGGANFQTIDEGWFGQNTSYGGADKLGHAYSSYLAALGFASLYESWGYERPKADLYGAISSMSAFTLVEVGDAFSKNGFSWEDLVADGAGVAFAYWRRQVPAVGRFVDFRVEYIPSETFINGDHSDIVSDYSGFKYLLAFKLDGIEKLSKTPLGWLELQVGYYTRGFATGDSDYYDEKTRNLYFAVGINVSRLLSKLGLRGVGKVFEYYQAPYTYVPFDWTLPQ
ncbi:MAG: YfiM family protein, partial [Actinobacteria bacterium]|nr:YfiM family protein [Actinomycetota bacterium]